MTFASPSYAGSQKAGGSFRFREGGGVGRHAAWTGSCPPRHDARVLGLSPIRLAVRSDGHLLRTRVKLGQRRLAPPRGERMMNDTRVVRFIRRRQDTSGGG